MTKKEAMIHTLVKENNELETEIGRLRQALEQKSCKDTISREAVLKEIPVLWNSNGDKAYCMESLRDFITELPPAVPAHKKGKWVANHDESDDSHTIDCSCCNYTLVRVVNRGYTAKQALDCVKDMVKNYCPSCGSEMESEDNGSN